MTDLRKAAEMALKYFEGAYGLEDMEIKIKEALRQALAKEKEQGVITYRTGYESGYMDASIALKREWVGLTDEEIEDEHQGLMATYIEEVDPEYWSNCDFEFAKAIEAKLREKNT